MIGWVFPGQGSQFVGMADAFGSATAQKTWATAGEVLGRDVRAPAAHGPKETLDATEVAQSAILTASVAAARALEEAGVRPDLVAGHSVGEFAALVIAGALMLIALARGDGLPGNMVLTADLSAPLPDSLPQAALSLAPRPLSVMETIFALDQAGRDPRVKGFFVRLGSAGISVPQAE